MQHTSSGILGGGLMFDEVSIQEDVQINSKSAQAKLHGLVDLGPANGLHNTRCGGRLYYISLNSKVKVLYPFQLTQI